MNVVQVIGNSSDPTAATTKQFGEFWAELAKRFRTNPKVIFGINNEPHDMVCVAPHLLRSWLIFIPKPTQLVLANNQAAINGIRSVGAAQLILAPGNAWTGGHSFTQVSGNNYAPSSDYMNKMWDPLHNLAIDIHEYLDEDYSGTHANCTQPAPSNLAALTAWLKENKLKAMITEFGGGDNDVCYQMLDEMFKYMDANDEYIGWSIWAAGPLWGRSSPCCGAETGSLEPNMLNADGKPEYVTIVFV
ncbi:hypothetical protein H0H93_004048 [Arthromyces matolae]|nr:hypothetical protein H0H93_004048 [Arthromyces matolae]